MDRITRALELAHQSRPRPSASRDWLAREPDPEARIGDLRDDGDRPLDTNEVPVFRTDAHRLEQYRVMCGPRHVAVESYRMLRTRVLQRMRAEGWKVLGVASPEQSEGKSVTAINLALSIATESPEGALLVDLDLRRPQVGHYLGIPPARGSVGGQEPDGTSKLVRLDLPGGLLVLPCDERGKSQWERPSGEHAHTVLQALRSRFGRSTIVCDLPPVLVTHDVLAMAPSLDAVLLVVSEGQTVRENVARAIDLLAPLPVIGTLLNKARRNSGRAY